MTDMMDMDDSGPDTLRSSFSLKRDEDGTRALRETLATAMDAVGAEGRARYRAELVAEEILTNLVKYGGGPGPDPVEFELIQEPTELRMEVVDATPPYSPESSEPEQLGQDNKRLRHGGLGLSLVRKSTDALFYDVDEDGRNRTIAIFRRDHAKEAEVDPSPNVQQDLPDL